MFLHHLNKYIFTVIMGLYHRCDWLWLFAKHLLNLEAYWIILETNHGYIYWLTQSNHLFLGMWCQNVKLCFYIAVSVRLRLFPPWINRYLKVRWGNSRMQQLTRGTWSLGFPAAQPGCCRHSWHRGGVIIPGFYLGSICFHVFFPFPLTHRTQWRRQHMCISSPPWHLFNTLTLALTSFYLFIFFAYFFSLALLWLFVILAQASALIQK